jgi:hypothetical protein
MNTEFQTGDRVIVNGHGDLYFEYESRAFIGNACTVLKKTKGGLYHVSLDSDPKKTYSLAKRNLDPIPDYSLPAFVQATEPGAVQYEIIYPIKFLPRVAYYFAVPGENIPV